MNVDNRPIIRKLTLRALKGSKMRNVVAVIAIALTSVLFTSLFTLGSNLLASVEEETMRLVGTRAHGGFKYLNREQYDNISKSPHIKDISYNIILAVAENDALKKAQCEIRCAEDKQAEWSFSFPSVGRMPRAENELACGTFVLDALGVPREIGAIVPLEFTVGGQKKYSEAFMLSGFWESDRAAPAHQIWLSEAYVVSALAENGAPNDGYTGTISADVWFSSAFDTEGKMKRLLAERGYAAGEINVGVNWAYAGGKPDGATMLLAAFALALISLSGHLIIYSVFAISVNADIRFYGLLKTIGATGKQIRRIVRGQAFALSAVGIPVGLIAGFFAGASLTPLASGFLSFEVSGGAGANPPAFVFSALFSLFTVFISCRKPAKLASKASPVEAVQYSAEPARTRKKSKRTGKITPLSFAWANATREKKKLCVVVLSLSLAFILLNSVFSAVNGFNMNEYLKASVLSDFALADGALFVPARPGVGDGVPASALDDIAARPGVLNMESVYFHAENGLAAPPENKENFEALKAALTELMPHRAAILEEGYENTYDLQIYGIGSRLAERIGVDYDKLHGGAYADRFDYRGERLGIHNVGDKIALKTDAGVAELAVVGLFDDYPFAASARYSSPAEAILLLSDEQFARIYGETRPMQVNIDVAPDKIEEFEAWLGDYTESQAPNLSFVSRNTLKKEFDGLRRTYLGIGGAMSFVIALIGVLNFVNAMAASIFTRRRELAMLQSVGMTGGQLKRMLIFEGCWHTVLTAAFTLTVGFALTCAITELIAGRVWFFGRNMTLVPSLLCLPFLLAVCVAVPVICHARLSGESVVERLRTE
jgi:putative ABC transport system permease protein